MMKEKIETDGDFRRKGFVRFVTEIFKSARTVV